MSKFMASSFYKLFSMILTPSKFVQSVFWWPVHKIGNLSNRIGTLCLADSLGVRVTWAHIFARKSINLASELARTAESQDEF